MIANGRKCISFHPTGQAAVHAMAESRGETQIIAVATLPGQREHCEWTTVADSLAVETDEVVDAQAVNVAVEVAVAVLDEPLAEGSATDADGSGQVGQRETVVQVKFRFLAAFTQEMGNARSVSDVQGLG